MEEPVARAPLARPRRQRSTLCTLCSFIGLVAALGIVYWTIRASAGAMYKLNTFHYDLTDVDPNSAGDSRPLARPLLDRKTPFSVRATVWLDVTQHLAQGLPLPPSSSSQLHSYTVATADRSELVLFDDIVAHNVTMLAQTVAKLPVDIPVDPLYTQDLGPSSLRVAFTVVPGSEALDGLGSLASMSSMFRGSKQMLPRTPDSERLEPGRNSPSLAASREIESIATALDQNGASVPLLTLLPAGLLHEPSAQGDASPQCGRLIETTMPFLDNAWQNRHFVNHVQSDASGNRLYLDQDCQVHLPNVRSRVSLVMLKDYRSFYHSAYLRTQNQVVVEKVSRESSVRSASVLTRLPFLQRTCHSLSPASEFTQLHLEDHCSLVRKQGPLELLLTFNSTDGDRTQQQHRYAPSLRTQRNAGNLRHHLTLPRRRPSADDEPIAPASQCAIPHIELSDDHDYFHADIEVQISAHKAVRSNVGEYLNIFSQPSDPDSLPLDEGQEVTLNSTMDMEILWEAKCKCGWYGAVAGR